MDDNSTVDDTHAKKKKILKIFGMTWGFQTFLRFYSN